MAHDIVFPIQHRRQSPHVVFLRLMVRVHQSAALVSVPRVVSPLQSVPFPVLPIMLLFVMVPFPWTVRDQGAMVPEKFGARRTVVSGILPAVIGPGIIIGHIWHQGFVSLDFLIHRVVLDHSELFGASPVYPPLLGGDFGVRVIDVLTAVVVVMLAPVLVFVVFAEDHLLAARGMLGHVNVWVPEVVVVASRGLVSLRVVQGAFFVLDNVAGWARGYLTIALWVGTMHVARLRHLTGQRVVVGKRRRVPWVMLRRSVLGKRETFVR